MSKLTPPICKLVSDPNAQVRDTAVDTLVDLYAIFGDAIAQEIQRKQLVTPTK